MSLISGPSVVNIVDYMHEALFDLNQIELKEQDEKKIEIYASCRRDMLEIFRKLLPLRES